MWCVRERERERERESVCDCVWESSGFLLDLLFFCWDFRTILTHGFGVCRQKLVWLCVH